MKLTLNTGTESSLINPALDALEACRRGEFPADFEHPFLDVPEPLRSRLPTEFVYRDLHLSRYGFAVPTEALVRYLAARSRELGGIVEVGAGAGYVASLVLQVGGMIFPTDLQPEQWPTPHTAVTQQDAHSAAVAAAQAGQGLLFSWPDMAAWTDQALDAYLKVGWRAGGVCDRRGLERLHRHAPVPRPAAPGPDGVPAQRDGRGAISGRARPLQRDAVPSLNRGFIHLRNEANAVHIRLIQNPCSFTASR